MSNLPAPITDSRCRRLYRFYGTAAIALTVLGAVVALILSFADVGHRVMTASDYVAAAAWYVTNAAFWTLAQYYWVLSSGKQAKRQALGAAIPGFLVLMVPVVILLVAWALHP